VCNLNNETTENTLNGFFTSKNLAVKKTRLLFDGSGKSKGAGFVEFNNTTDAQEAVKNLTGSEVDGKRVIVQIAKQ